MEEAAISLGASKLKTFLLALQFPMIVQRHCLRRYFELVAIITEVSSAVILYNNSTMTLTIGTYITISYSRGVPCAFAAVTPTLIT
jgi:iron(III) transport system permease protein